MAPFRNRILCAGRQIVLHDLDQTLASFLTTDADGSSVYPMQGHAGRKTGAWGAKPGGLKAKNPNIPP
jgi:hypothetical protein